MEQLGKQRTVVEFGPGNLPIIGGKNHAANFVGGWTIDPGRRYVAVGKDYGGVVFETDKASGLIPQVECDWVGRSSENTYFHRVHFAGLRNNPIPCEDGEVSIAVARNVVTEFRDKRPLLGMLEETARVLGPGGKLIIAENYVAGGLPHDLDRIAGDCGLSGWVDTEDPMRCWRFFADMPVASKKDPMRVVIYEKL